MKYVYIVSSSIDGTADTIIGVFEDLTEAKKCAEAMSIATAREWSSSIIYLEVFKTVQKGDYPKHWDDRHMVTARWLDDFGKIRTINVLYYITQRTLNQCIAETEEYKNIVKGL